MWTTWHETSLKKTHTHMRHVDTSATEREGLQERFVRNSQVGPCRFIDETCRASEQTVRSPFVSNAKKRSRRESHGRRPPRRARRSCNNETKVSRMTSGVPSDCDDTATNSAQLCRKNSSTRNRRTTHLKSQSFTAEHQQQKNNFSTALTTRATFPWAAKAMRPLNTWIPNHVTTSRAQ